MCYKKIKKELLKLFFENWEKIINKRLKLKKYQLIKIKFTRRKTNKDKKYKFFK